MRARIVSGVSSLLAAACAGMLALWADSGQLRVVALVLTALAGVSGVLALREARRGATERRP